MKNRYGRPRSWVVCTLVLIVVSASHGWSRTATVRLTLGRALALARKNNPTLEAMRTRIGEARADLVGARIPLAYNPRLNVVAGARVRPRPASALPQVLVGLTQRFEVAGQRRHRIQRAKAAMSASHADLADARRTLFLLVAWTFADALAAADRVQLARDNESLAKALHAIAARRVARGAAAPLAINAARIRYAEARRQLLKAQTNRHVVVVRLARLLGIASATAIATVGKLPSTSSVSSLAHLLKKARATRPDLAKARHRVLAARHAAALATAKRWPDLTFGFRYVRDDGDNLIMGIARLPLPLFNRNQGGRARSLARIKRLRATQQAVEVAITAQVRRAYAQHSAAGKTLALYNAQVVRAQRANLRLIRLMYRAGKIGYAEVVLLQRELLEARLSYLDARLQLARTAIALRAAAGQAPVIGRAP